MASISDQWNAFKELYTTTGVDIGGTNVHQGSFYGLPDLGISEALASTSDVQAASTEQLPTINDTSPTNTSTLDGTVSGGTEPIPTGSDPVDTGPSEEELLRQQYEQEQISNINSKWDPYLASLDSLIGGLPGEATTLEEGAGIRKERDLTDLGFTTDANKAELTKDLGVAEEENVETLKDVSSNIRNLMQAGNRYLGSVGAGDSSAVNQYSYALTKLGSEQRGDVQRQTRNIKNDIQGRIARVANIFAQESSRIKSDFSAQVNSIATWLADKQKEIQLAKAQGLLDKGTDLQNLTDNLYQIAVTNLTNTQNAYRDKESALQSWALSTSDSLKQAQAKLEGTGFGFESPGINYQRANVTPRPTQGSVANTGFGGTSTDDKDKILGLA